MAHNELDAYEKLRNTGYTEEQALSEIREFVKTEHTRSENSEYVTRQDLKIALLEFAEKHKLGLMDLKLNFILFVLTAYLGVFGYILRLLFEISSKLPQ